MDGPLLAARLVSMFLLLIGALIFGISPVYVKNTLFRCECNGECKPQCRAKRGKIVTSFLIYFGGGVLLGTTFLHLLPESREGFEEHHDVNCSEVGNSTEEGHDHDHHESFPLPEFIVCCGFFAVYLFEEIVHYYLGGHTHVPTENKAIRSFSRSNSCSIAPQSLDAELSSSGKYSRTFSQPPKVPSISEEEKQDPAHRPPTPDDAKMRPASPPPSGHGHSHGPDPNLPAFSLTGLLTVAALSFHSLFEGFAVGLRPDAVSTWIVFAAISVHKYVIAFVVGLEVLATGGRNVHVYSYMSVFALMSPLGMAIAMITQSNVEDSSPMAVSVLNALATGTLLYVTFFEILQREEHKDIATWVQLIATCAGFLVMCLMQYVSTLA